MKVCQLGIFKYDYCPAMTMAILLQVDGNYESWISLSLKVLKVHF
jgi:hypothetical protein